MELISGLPDDLTLDCLIRLSYNQFPAIAAVCRAWKTEIQMPEFYRRRKAAGFTQKIVVMIQAMVDTEKSPSGAIKSTTNPVYRLSVCEPETGLWSEMPPIPDLSTGLPMFCQIAGVGYDLVVMGGWDPDSWKASNSVFVYNFISGKWRCGADMPGGARTLFGCASDKRRSVYVAGGHSEDKNALRSAFRYDVASDEWVPMPQMARERDECKAIFHNGKFKVIGGYCTERQGRFERTAEAFDVAMWEWDAVEEEYLDAAMCPRTCVDGGDDDEEKVYMCGAGGDVIARDGDTWQRIAKLGDEMRNVALVRPFDVRKILVIGSSAYSEPHVGIVLDLKTGNIKEMEIPLKYTGHIQSCCLVEI